jgi:ABC-type phosphate transport system substrate-binding protein
MIMKKKLVLFLFVALASLIGQRAYAQVIVIANPSVKAAAVSKAELSDVFTGSATTLKDGSRAVPILLKAGTVHEEFLQAYIGKSDSAYRAGWRSLVFSGQGAMPKSVDGDAAVVEFVAHNAGAIGYIGKNTPHDGVKVLAVK